MEPRLVDAQWAQELMDGMARSEGTILVACPFIKEGIARQLFERSDFGTLQVVTRFDLAGFAARVSDIAALEAIIESGGEVRGLRGLHAKVFVFGEQRAIVTSANLTKAALERNAEFGCVSEERAFVTACRVYVEDLWRRAGSSVTMKELGEWRSIVTRILLQGGRPDQLAALPDFGALSGADESSTPRPSSSLGDGSPASWPDESGTAYVKFFGQGHERAAPDLAVLHEVDGAGCHWACTYPKAARPRQVNTGDTMFMGRMTHDPHDTLIYGRGIGFQHVDARDTASPAEIAVRPWKVDWPHYIRVYSAEFVAGQLKDGPSLNALMDELGPHAFSSTREHLLTKDGGNTNPRHALMQQPAVRLSPEGARWMTDHFEQAVAVCGRILAVDLEGLDWPTVDFS
jgi:hypothetical protein